MFPSIPQNVSGGDATAMGNPCSCASCGAPGNDMADLYQARRNMGVAPWEDTTDAEFLGKSIGIEFLDHFLYHFLRRSNNFGIEDIQWDIP
jgi:hypothetical protein